MTTELQKVIFETMRNNTQIDLQDDRRLKGSQLAWAGYAADAVLAAGWSRPLVVSSVEELDALGRSSVIVDANGFPWVNDGDTEEPWASFNEDFQGGPLWVNADALNLPATVLFEGPA